MALQQQAPGITRVFAARNSRLVRATRVKEICRVAPCVAPRLLGSPARKRKRPCLRGFASALFLATDQGKRSWLYRALSSSRHVAS